MYLTGLYDILSRVWFMTPAKYDVEINYFAIIALILNVIDTKVIYVTHKFENQKFWVNNIRLLQVTFNFVAHLIFLYQII